MKGGINKNMEMQNRTTRSALILVFALVLAISTMSFVLAEENQTNVTDSGLVENASELGLNESVSGGEIAWKQFKLWFTLNEEKRIESELDLARLRLIQARIAAKNNNSEAMLKAMEAHERIMERVQERMNRLENSSDGSELNESAEKLVGLERAIQVHERRINFLNNTLQNANLTDEQRERIEEKIAKAGNVTAKLDELQEAKMDKLKTRLMAVANLTDDQAEKVLELVKENKEDKPRNESPKFEDRERRGPPKADDSEDLPEDESEDDSD